MSSERDHLLFSDASHGTRYIRWRCSWVWQHNVRSICDALVLVDQRAICVYSIEVYPLSITRVRVRIHTRRRPSHEELSWFLFTWPVHVYHAVFAPRYQPFAYRCRKRHIQYTGSTRGPCSSFSIALFFPFSCGYVHSKITVRSDWGGKERGRRIEMRMLEAQRRAERNFEKIRSRKQLFANDPSGLLLWNRTFRDIAIDSKYIAFSAPIVRAIGKWLL